MAATPIIDSFGEGLGTIVAGQVVMGAASGCLIITAQSAVLARLTSWRNACIWGLKAWGSFVLAGISYALFVRIAQGLLPYLRTGFGNTVILALGWGVKGAQVGWITGPPLFQLLGNADKINSGPQANP